MPPQMCLYPIWGQVIWGSASGGTIWYHLVIDGGDKFVSKNVSNRKASIRNSLETNVRVLD